MSKNNIEKLQAKFIEMTKIENELYENGAKFIIGVDEVGRGCLAGPVVAAAVILPRDIDILGIDDSKKLSEKRRKEIAKKIKEKAICYSIGLVDNKVIDEINILEATKNAMRGALLNLEEKLEKGFGEHADWVLIDALELPNMSIPQKGIIKGDSKSISIAAASILAKVTRDDLMVKLSEKYPYYKFEKNKGYGTKEHYKGIDEYGTCEIHRKSFLKKYFEKRKM